MYIGVKEFIAQYREPFNRDVKAKKKAKERLTERGISSTTKEGKIELRNETKLVLAEWDQKVKWGEQAHTTIQKEGMKKYPSAILGKYEKSEGDIIPNKVLDINALQANTRYYEKQIIDPLNGLIGWVDELYIDKNWNIILSEYKSTRNLNRDYTFMTPRGPMSNYYFHPISHVIDCNFNHSALQASFYMYLLWYYNKKLKPGNITIRHIILDEDTGKIESIIDYDAPFMLDEVKELLKYKKKK